MSVEEALVGWVGVAYMRRARSDAEGAAAADVDAAKEARSPCTAARESSMVVLLLGVGWGLGE